MFLRKAVVAAHGFLCAYCGAAADSADHIVPKKLDGEDRARNLIAACRSCNSAKGGRRLSPSVEADLKMRAWILEPLVNELAAAFITAQQEARARKKIPINLRGLLNE